MAPKFSKPFSSSPFVGKLPPSDFKGGGYKKHGDSEASDVQPPASSSAQPVDDNDPSDHEPSNHGSDEGGGHDGSDEGFGDDPDGSDDSIHDSNPEEETSEEEEKTDDEEVVDCQSCQALQVEVSRASQMSQAMCIAMLQGFHRAHGEAVEIPHELPDDRLELSQLVETLKRITSQAEFKKSNMIGILTEFAIYIKWNNVVKVVYVNSKCSVAKMKQKAVLAYGLPKSRVAMFDFVFDHGHRMVHRGFWFRKDEVMQKPVNRFHVSHVFKDTCQIVMKPVGGLMGGGKSGSVSGMPMKKVITTTRKQERDECMKKQDLSKMASAAKVVEAVNGAMTGIFDKVEQGKAIELFQKMMAALPDSAVGTKDESEMMNILKNSNTDTRGEKMIDIMLRGLYPQIFAIKTEVDTAIESASLTLEFLLSEAFIAEKSGKWSWASIKEVVMDEVKRRSSLKKDDVGADSDVEMLTADLSKMATG